MTNRKPFLLKMGRRIREIREKQGLNAAKVAERADVEASFLSKLENGLVWLGPESLSRIAQALGVGPGDLMPSDSPTSALNVTGRRVPILNRVPAGLWEEIIEGRSVDDVCEWAPVIRSDLGRRVFALRVEGDSMTPEYSDGDVILVDQDAVARPGKPVVAQQGPDKWTFKIYKIARIDEQGREIVKLEPLNDAYPPFYSDQMDIKIIGPVVEHHRFPY